MHKAFNFVLIVFILFAFTTSSLAQSTATAAAASEQPQVPRLIRFSGSITAHEARTVGFTFALYKDQTGGAPLWQEIQNVTPDAAGYYSVLLGANSKDGVPAELFTTNEARWLGVQVEQEAEPARILLVSVPYALKAADAETVGGHPLTDFILTPTANASTTTSGSGGTTSGGSTTVKKSATPSAVPSTPVTTAGGTQNFVAKFDSSGTNLINSSIFDNGNVGIGTSTPAARLEVGGAIGEAFRMSGVGTNPVSFRFTNAGNSAYFGIESSTAGGYFTGSLPYSTVIYSPQPIQNIIGSVARMTIDTNGNVGIGTSTPAARLEVAGAIGEAFRMTGVGTNPVSFRFSNTGNSAYFGIEGSTAGGYFTGALPYSTVIYSPQAIQNIVGGVPRMIIHTNGNVGIGTVSPGNPLTVAGTIESTSGGFRFPDASLQTSALPSGCSVNQIPKWSGSAWTCQPDLTTTGSGGGTVTSITGGTGLTGGTITTSGTIALDTSFTDSRYVQAGANNTFTGANTLQGETTIGGGGIAKDGAGLKHVRRIFGGISPGGFGTGTFSWDTPFADTNYTVTCNFLDTVDGAGLRLHRIKSTTTTSVTVVFSNDDLSTPFKSGTLHCIAIHD